MLSISALRVVISQYRLILNYRAIFQFRRIAIKSERSLTAFMFKYDIILDLQGQCASSWAFSAVAAVESQFAIQADVRLDLSEQNLVDCSTEVSVFSSTVTSVCQL